MKKIGVLGRHNKEFRDYHITTEIEEMVLSYGCYPVMIMPSEEFEAALDIINLCDGIILPGGMDYTDFDAKLIKHVFEHDIPTLGICLGCQIMGKTFNGNVELISEEYLNHKNHDPYVHKIDIFPSKLFDAIGEKSIKVNSIHRRRITKTDLKVNCLSEDGIIEGVEDPNKTFFVGVQWHPEMMLDYDKNSNKLIKCFFDKVLTRK